MAAGTAAALVPIKSITMRSKNDKFLYQDGGDEPGPACVRFLTTLKGIQQGKIEDKFGWLEEVKEAKVYNTRKIGNHDRNGVNGTVDKLSR